MQIRKILDLGNNNSPYKTLRFYCNWVLHTYLDQQATTKLLAEIFVDSTIDLAKTGHENACSMKFVGKDFFKLKSFRKELKDFLENYQLPIDSLGNWSTHTGKITLEIIKDVPVKFIPTQIKELQIKKYEDGNFGYTFTFSNGNHASIVLKLK